MNCLKCKDTGWILYQKAAPSPPYKENQQLDYGVECDCKNGQSERRNQTKFREEDEIH